MKKIAALLTCFNRKDKTLSALRHLFDAQKSTHPGLELVVYLTDDGSTDGTSEEVKKNFPEVIILQGNGELFWAGGMRNSWEEANKKDYDGFLLLNDDTNVFENVFDQLLGTHDECLDRFGTGGIYIGSTKDAQSGKFTYGGASFQNRFLFKYSFLEPNGSVQSCELGNANIMLVSKHTVAKVGTLSKGYRHGVADYDYTLKALNKKIPLLVPPLYCGTCSHDHSDIYQTFPQKTLKERFRLLRHPLGLDFNSNLLLMRKHFPVRVPFVVGAAVLKVIFPKIYVKGRGKG